jgi:outer membrane protein assembly factor BamB
MGGSRQLPDRPLAAASVVVGGGRAVFTLPTADYGRLDVMDLATGAMLWERAIVAASAEPILVGDTVLVAETQGAKMPRLLALDAATGDQRWVLGLPAGGFLPGYEAAVDGNSYVVADRGGGVSLVDLTTHRVRWHTRAIVAGAKFATTILTATSVVVSADGHGVVQLDRRTGRVLRRNVVGAPEGGFVRSIAAQGPIVYGLLGHGTAGVVQAQRP